MSYELLAYGHGTGETRGAITFFENTESVYSDALTVARMGESVFENWARGVLSTRPSDAAYVGDLDRVGWKRVIDSLLEGVEQDTFTLRIRMGNDAVQTAGDIAELLTHTAIRVESSGRVQGNVIDVNGNHVGAFGLV